MKRRPITPSPNEELYQAIGRRIRLAREDLGLGQEELSKRVGLTRTSITNIEKGRQSVQVHTLYAIAHALNRQVEAFLPNSSATEVNAEATAEEIPERSLSGEDYTEKDIDWIKQF